MEIVEREQHIQSDFRFDTRELCTETEVRAPAKALCAGERATNVERVRIVLNVGIMVG